MESDCDYTLPLKSLLKLGGIWTNFSNQKFSKLHVAFQYFRYLYSFIVLLIMLREASIRGLKFLLSPTAIFVPLGSATIITSFIMTRNMKGVEILLDKIKKNLSSYKEDWEIEVIKRERNQATIIVTLYNHALGYFGLFYILMPLVVDLVRVLQGRPDTFRVPLPLDMFLEGKNRSFNLYLITFFSDIWFVFGLLSSMAFEGTLFYMISFATAEIKILKIRIGMLYDEDTFFSQSLIPSPNWELRNIVNKHQQIIRLITDQCDCITLPYVVQNVIVTLSFCFVLYSLTQSFGNDNFLFFYCISFIVILFGLVFLLSLAGEYLQVESTEIFDKLCNLPWYLQSPKSRRDLRMIIMMASKPLILKYKIGLPLTLVAFMQVVNNSYSYFMLLKSL